MGKNWKCMECGGTMYKADDVVLVCNSCGHSVDIIDYRKEESFFDYFPTKDTDPPEGCIACGGPYPKCKTSCKLFD
ncbi:MAG: hypothetical protein K9L62_01970 [Vallitaleaceae bacterium]|nr:hypothetical protein [Vallitaleaceae bacterium]